MTFSHPLARSAKVFTAHNLDGAEEKILAVATTLELDPKGEHYKKRFVEKLSDATRDYVRRSDRVTAFVLINRLKDWREPPDAHRRQAGGAGAQRIQIVRPQFRPIALLRFASQGRLRRDESA
jgi:hypothetical protein